MKSPLKSLLLCALMLGFAIPGTLFGQDLIARAELRKDQDEYTVTITLTNTTDSIITLRDMDLPWHREAWIKVNVTLVDFGNQHKVFHRSFPSSDSYPRPVEIKGHGSLAQSIKLSSYFHSDELAKIEGSFVFFLAHRMKDIKTKKEYDLHAVAYYNRPSP